MVTIILHVLPRFTEESLIFDDLPELLERPLIKLDAFIERQEDQYTAP